MRLIPLALLLSGCVWIGDQDLTDRYAELTDRDGDGYQDAAYGGDDCDDSNATIHPGAEEACNELDDDCDGTADDGLLTPWYTDGDGDGYGDPDAMVLACVAPSGTVDDATDCDDADADINADAEELCNGVDDDCDGGTDEADATDASTWYQDSDGDGYGDPDQHSLACTQPSGTVESSTDCDDSDASVHPGATELCNGVDDDCDGDTDEPGAADAPTWYQDADGDGYGDATDSLTACTQPTGYVAPELATDCDDSDATIYPGGVETLADSDDGDCDGGDDTFPFALIDTRSAQSVEGPALAQGGGNVYLGWAAERITDSGYLYDVVAVDILDGEAPWEGEADFWASGETTNTAFLGRFDLVANDTVWTTVSSWLDTSQRTIQVDAVNASSGAHGTYRSQAAWTVGFDQLQAGLSLSYGNVTAVGCGLYGAGLQAVQINAVNLSTGSATPGADTFTHETWDDHDVCEYDHLAYQFYMFSSTIQHLDYYAFDFGTDTLYSTHSDTSTWLVSDMEVTTENDWEAMALTNLFSGYGFQLRVIDYGGTDDELIWGYTATPIQHLDVSVSPAGVPYACGVDNTGNAFLLWSELLGVPSPVFNALALQADDLSTIEDCAITVTADSVAVIALRGGDDIAYASVRVP